MRNYANKVIIASIFFFALFGIYTNVLAQDYTCPTNAYMCDRNIESVSHRLEDDIYVMKSLTGYSTPDEASLYCDQMIKEKTSIVNELNIDDYDGTIAKIKLEVNEAKALLELQTQSCNACLASKLEAYENKFIKKHGDHRYDTKGYRTKVVVVWGEAERIPTDAQAKYDLLYDEYMSNYNPTNDRQECRKSTPACSVSVETEAKISSLNSQISELRERHNNEISAQYDLEKTVSLCASVSKSIENYNAKISLIAFLKTCKYPEKQETTSANTNTENNKNSNMNSLSQAKKAINNANSVGRAFGF